MPGLSEARLSHLLLWSVSRAFHHAKTLSHPHVAWLLRPAPKLASALHVLNALQSQDGSNWFHDLPPSRGSLLIFLISPLSSTCKSQKPGNHPFSYHLLNSCIPSITKSVYSPVLFEIHLLCICATTVLVCVLPILQPKQLFNKKKIYAANIEKNKHILQPK